MQGIIFSVGLLLVVSCLSLLQSWHELFFGFKDFGGRWYNKDVGWFQDNFDDELLFSIFQVKMCESDKLHNAEQKLHDTGLQSEKYKNANMNLR